MITQPYTGQRSMSRQMTVALLRISRQHSKTDRGFVLPDNEGEGAVVYYNRGCRLVETDVGHRAAAHVKWGRRTRR